METNNSDLFKDEGERGHWRDIEEELEQEENILILKLQEPINQLKELMSKPVYIDERMDAISILDFMTDILKPPEAKETESKFKYEKYLIDALRKVINDGEIKIPFTQRQALRELLIYKEHGHT